MQVKPTPTLPTAIQVELHRVTHLPYREWCDCCVEGCGREDCHRKAKQPGSIAVISLDYFFITAGAAYTRKEWGDGKLEETGEKFTKVLVLRDARRKMFLAHAVRVKGVDDEGYIVDNIVGRSTGLDTGRCTSRATTSQRCCRSFAKW